MAHARNVFLDTQVFDHELYDFASFHLAVIKSLADDALINVYLTEVTRREIETRIEEKVTSALRAVKQLRKERDNNILRHVGPPFDGLFQKHRQADIVAKLRRQFSDYCESIGATVLAVGEIDGGKICADYFDENPPFSAGRKKAEFPDAIAAAVLDKWCVDFKRAMNIISGDGDWKGVSDRVEHFDWFETISDFLALYPDPAIVSDIKHGLELVSGEMREFIGSQFEGLGFIPSDVDGDIEEVGNVTVDIERILVLKAEDGVATVELDCEIWFSADVVYDLPGTGIWDREDQRMYMVEREHATVQDTVHKTVELELTYDEEEPSVFSTESAFFDSLDVEVDCSELINDW